ncbi:MAG: hypothetical protein H7138_27515 [Myxococcales bacterium]|nr:hypothetical protein [Myxococcales bacterium]
MRRAALVVVGIVLLGTARRSGAEPWTVTMEGGGEADSNVSRVDSGSPTARTAAPVARAGARIDHKDRVLGGAYVLGLSGLARFVGSRDIEDENVMLYTGDARWLRVIAARPLAIGFGVTAADSSAIGGGVGARTFRNLGADILLALGNGAERHLLLAVGGRDFSYKRGHIFDWRGPTVSARLDLLLWQPQSKTRTLELAATLGFESRRYNSNALTNSCPPSAPATELCSTGTSLTRYDRYQRAGAEINWTGEIVATAGYQLTAIDSNSYGQSLVRHRILASATTELIDKLFGTVTATLQLDRYPDGLLVANDVTLQEFTNLEDDSRSSLQIRIARELTTAWSLEVRGAVWRDLGNPGAAAFRRELAYAGVIYSR